MNECAEKIHLNGVPIVWCGHFGRRVAEVWPPNEYRQNWEAWMLTEVDGWVFGVDASPGPDAYATFEEARERAETWLLTT